VGERWVGDPIRIHLNLLLNTRVGSVPHLPDYGVPDMSSFFSDYPASMSKLRAVIEDLIRKYEPRLLDPHVQLTETGTSEFRVSFLITGEIEEDDEMAFVKYRTTISSTGQAALGEGDG
jgi:type VI secretion system protein